MPSPLVSYIIPTHNRPTGLESAIECAGHQSHNNVEIIVVNDGAEFCEYKGEAVAVREVAEKTAKRFNRQLLYVPSELSPRKVAGARNAGLDVAQGDYIAYLDDDDLHLPHHLLVNLRELRQGAQMSVSYIRTLFQKRGQPDELADKPPIPMVRALLAVNNLHPPSSLVHQNLGKRIWDPKMHLLEDWDAYLRLVFEYGLEHASSPVLTGYYRRSRDREAMSNTEPVNFYEACKKVWTRWEPYWRDSTDAPLIRRLLVEAIAFQTGQAPELLQCSDYSKAWTKFATRLYETYRELTDAPEFRPDPKFDDVMRRLTVEVKTPLSVSASL